jgi:hypothetical protein
MFYLIYTTDYDEPCPMQGPFPTYQDALEAYRANLIESGADIEEELTTEELYFDDDNVRIGRLV